MSLSPRRFRGRLLIYAALWLVLAVPAAVWIVATDHPDPNATEASIVPILLGVIAVGSTILVGVPAVVVEVAVAVAVRIRRHSAC